MNLSLLEAQKEKVKSIEYYKATLISLDVDALTPKDLISLSKTTQELLHKEINKTHTNVKKLQ